MKTNAHPSQDPARAGDTFNVGAKVFTTMKEDYQAVLDYAGFGKQVRGFPATPGTSQVWRIKPGTVGAVCDPEEPWHGRCKRYADGLTSIVDLGASRRSVYAVSLSKMRSGPRSW